MNIFSILRFALLIFCTTLVIACSVNKLEARIEAEPQCKPVMNAKTGALMPCPGTDKAFYRAAGVGNKAPAVPVLASAAPALSPQASASPDQKSMTAEPAVRQVIFAPVECKPQIHQKTGALMPCPSQ